MYYKVTDKKNNSYIFKIMKDKNLHYEQKKDDFWRISNITIGSILVPTFKSPEDALKFLKDIKSWNVEELDLTKLNKIIF